MPDASWSMESLLSPDGLPSTVKVLLLLSLLSVVPSLLLMTTCFVRVAVVLGLLRQALGTQQFLPNQVTTGLSLMLTLTVMWPVWREAYETGIVPYSESTFATEAEQAAGFERTIESTMRPLRRFMSGQIAATGNEAAIDMLLQYQSRGDSTPIDYPTYYEDVPLSVLLPAYVLSELKTAFLIGFQIYLPFVVIDLVVAALLSGMGLMMMPPGLVSLPLKLLMFVMVDGWFLVVQTLLMSMGGPG